MNPWPFFAKAHGVEYKPFAKELGFEKINNPLLRKTLGRAMTIKKACEEQKVDFDVLRQKIVAEIPVLKT
jgi:hypothetical protein